MVFFQQLLQLGRWHGYSIPFGTLLTSLAEWSMAIQAMSRPTPILPMGPTGDATLWNFCRCPFILYRGICRMRKLVNLIPLSFGVWRALRRLKLIKQMRVILGMTLALKAQMMVLPVISEVLLTPDPVFTMMF